MMPGELAASRWKELCAEYHARPKVRYSEFDDFLVEQIVRLEAEKAALLAACRGRIERAR
jgi:hypothetical protein